MSRRAFFFRAAGVFAAMLFFVSCGPRKIGYGMVVWSDNEAVRQTGSVIPVYGASRLKQTYTAPNPTPESSRAVAEIPQWRLQFFTDEGDARSFAEGFAEVRDLYATSNRNALPVREKPDRLSRQVYRLRLNETMKILALSTTMTNENGLQGYWYTVLTEEGVTGFCFNYYLTLFNAKTGEVLSRPQDSSRESIERILSASWRPLFFREMKNSGRIDLNRFRSSCGLFFDEEPQQMRIELPESSTVVPFIQIRKVSGDLYIAEGSDVEIRLRQGGAEMALTYTRGTRRRTESFIDFPEDPEEMITAERERRKSAFEGFIKQGATLSSQSYGEIRISPQREFVWTGFSRLVPDVIPYGVQSTGALDFSVFMSKETAENWTGVVTFRFAGTSPRAVDFFYRLTAQGMQLVHIPPENIEDNVVRRPPRSPLVMVFTPL
ncbi:MAG: SH3 domain-containing protein [Spirochaetales bacterium]|jgi:hypothetical protein|nr:SH3 domain-containing protein [Spirochaetales bacterium]